MLLKQKYMQLQLNGILKNILSLVLIVQETLELLYNPVDDNIIHVFHAMKLRDSTIEIAGL